MARRLEDFYVVHSDPVEISDNQTTITVVCRKLNDVEHETAVQKATAARARRLRHRTNPDSDEYLAALDEILKLGDDRQLLGLFLARDELAEQLMSIRARIAGQGRWVEEDYLTGLVDAYDDDMKLVWATASDDNADEPAVIEAREIHDELERYEDEVRQEWDAAQDQVLGRYENADIDQLRHDVVMTTITEAGQLAFYEEFRRCRIWLGTRVHQIKPGSITETCPDGELDLSIRYFPDRAAVDSLHGNIRKRLDEVFTEIEVGPAEGKDLPAQAGSSTPSARRNASATAGSSGRQAATG